MTQPQVSLADLKSKTPADLLAMAEDLEIDNASTMRKGDMMFDILKERAEEVGFQQAVAERDSGEPIAPGASKPSVPAVPPHDAELHSKL